MSDEPIKNMTAAELAVWGRVYANTLAEWGGPGMTEAGHSDFAAEADAAIRLARERTADDERIEEARQYVADATKRLEALAAENGRLLKHVADLQEDNVSLTAGNAELRRKLEAKERHCDLLDRQRLEALGQVRGAGGEP